MSGFISSSPFQNTKQFLQIRSLAPGIARRSSEWFQLRRAITPNPCIICGIRGYRCVRLVEGFIGTRSVRRLDPRISGNRWIPLSSDEGLLLRWASSMDFNLVLHFFSLLPAQPSLSPHRPPIARPPTPARPPCPCPRCGGGDRPWRPSGSGTAARGGGATPFKRGPTPPTRVARRRPSSSPRAAPAPFPWP
jgi:hypothetical protein